MLKSAYHRRIQELQQQQGSDAQALLPAAVRIAGVFTVEHLIEMRTQVEGVIARNPFNPETRKEFFRARLAVRRLGDAAIGVTSAMGAIGLVSLIVGIALLSSGFGAAACIPFLAIGIASLKLGIIPMMGVFTFSKEAVPRHNIGMDMYRMEKAAEQAPRLR